MTARDLPTLNAALNGTAAVLLAAGWWCIRNGYRAAHRGIMLAAAAVSGAFLVSYVTHKVLLRGVHTPFPGPPAWRAAYLALLLSHTVLAAALAGLVPWTLALALRGRHARHRAWARWTLPLWGYVSVTGVVIYCSLYVWWPAAR